MDRQGGKRRVFHGIFDGIDIGIDMGFLMGLYGVYMGFIWDLYGVYMGFIWDLYHDCLMNGCEWFYTSWCQTDGGNDPW